MTKGTEQPSQSHARPRQAWQGASPTLPAQAQDSNTSRRGSAQAGEQESARQQKQEEEEEKELEEQQSQLKEDKKKRKKKMRKSAKKAAAQDSKGTNQLDSTKSPEAKQQQQQVCVCVSCACVCVCVCAMYRHEHGSHFLIERKHRYTLPPIHTHHLSLSLVTDNVGLRGPKERQGTGTRRAVQMEAQGRVHVV